MRHYINLKILYSILTTYATVGPFELNWETQQYKCWISQYITFSLLACLQTINIFWLVYILNIALNVLIKPADFKDDRSNDEESDDEGVEETEKVKRSSAAVNGKPKTPLPVGISSGVENPLNGCAVESGPNTPVTPAMPTLKGRPEALPGESNLKKR